MQKVYPHDRNALFTLSQHIEHRFSALNDIWKKNNRKTTLHFTMLLDQVSLEQNFQIITWFTPQTKESSIDHINWVWLGEMTFHHGSNVSFRGPITVQVVALNHVINKFVHGFLSSAWYSPSLRSVTISCGTQKLCTNLYMGLMKSDNNSSLEPSAKCDSTLICSPIADVKFYGAPSTWKDRGLHRPTHYNGPFWETGSICCTVWKQEAHKGLYLVSEYQCI